MTEKKSRQVVIMNNLDSENIEQAIFILKANTPQKPSSDSKDPAQEAQQIINEYIHLVDRLKYNFAISQDTSEAKAPKGVQLVVFSALSLLCIALSIALLFNIH